MWHAGNALPGGFGLADPCSARPPKAISAMRQTSRTRARSARSGTSTSVASRKPAGRSVLPGSRNGCPASRFRRRATPGNGQNAEAMKDGVEDGKASR